MDNLIQQTHNIMAANANRWLALVEAFSPDLLWRRPAPGEWSALECLQHVIDTERDVIPQRIEFLLAQQDFAAFDPHSQGTKPNTANSPKALAEEFARLRAVTLKVLARVAPADLNNKARHAELGPVTMSELLHELAGHDLMHVVQAERAVMQPFINASGPWRPYFEDHDTKSDAL